VDSLCQLGPAIRFPQQQIAGFELRAIAEAPVLANPEELGSVLTPFPPCHFLPDKRLMHCDKSAWLWPGSPRSESLPAIGPTTRSASVVGLRAAFALGDASPRTLCSTRKDGQCTVCYTPRITIVEVLSGWKR
jgi:hypothetical protein